MYTNSELKNLLKKIFYTFVYISLRLVVSFPNHSLRSDGCLTYISSMRKKVYDVLGVVCFILRLFCHHKDG